MEFITGQHLLAMPEIRRYVLTNSFNGHTHLTTESMLKDAFKSEYIRIMANRHPAWFVHEYFD